MSKATHTIYAVNVDPCVPSLRVVCAVPPMSFSPNGANGPGSQAQLSVSVVRYAFRGIPKSDAPYK
jgi:hypothetical protein